LPTCLSRSLQWSRSVCFGLFNTNMTYIRTSHVRSWLQNGQLNCVSSACMDLALVIGLRRDLRLPISMSCAAVDCIPTEVILNTRVRSLTKICRFSYAIVSGARYLCVVGWHARSHADDANNAHSLVTDVIPVATWRQIYAWCVGNDFFFKRNTILLNKPYWNAVQVMVQPLDVLTFPAVALTCPLWRRDRLAIATHSPIYTLSVYVNWIFSKQNRQNKFMSI
jgi:hypothetical protein